MEGNQVDSGIAYGNLLSDLVEQTLNCDSQALAQTRKDIVSAIGPEALVDAAAIIGNFQRMVRIADGTGIPLDKPVAIMSADIRQQLNFDRFGSADLTPKVGTIGRWFGRTFGPQLLKRLAKKRAPSTKAAN